MYTSQYGFLSFTTDTFSGYARAMCNSYMQLTARGVSILFASGDGGVASTPGVYCKTTFPPTFPTVSHSFPIQGGIDDSNSRYVYSVPSEYLCLPRRPCEIDELVFLFSATLVGATQNVNPEIGALLSAGGFSNYFARPSWRQSFLLTRPQTCSLISDFLFDRE